VPADPPGGPRVCTYRERLFPLLLCRGWVVAWVALAVARAGGLTGAPWAGVGIGHGIVGVGYCLCVSGRV